MDVLITDDDTQILEGVKRVFERRGHFVQVCATGRETLKAVEERSFHLIILDWGLPDMEGVEVVTRLRGAGRTIPILMLTARSENEDLVQALDAGADDFMAKQAVRTDVLLARAEALVRRAQYPAPPKHIVAGNLVVDEGSNEARISGVLLDLAPSEFKVLALLAGAPGKVVNRAELVSGCWGEGADVSDNALESVIKRLRKKLGDEGERLQSVRLRGYVYVVPRSGSDF